MITGPLFPKLRDCAKKFIILQGGTSSGKTVTALQYLAVYAIEHPNSVITVVGQDIPNLKKGAIRDFEIFVQSDPEIAPHIKSHNITDRVWTFNNKTIIEFNSYKDEQDAKSGKRDVLFVNEANGIPYMVFWQLQRRTRQKVIIDYNPNSEFWAHQKLLGGKDKEFPERKVQLYITDHRHNPFLTDDDHESIESISDIDLHKVYARGMTGKIKGLIYGHFKPCDEIPADCEEVIFAIDYGYTNDPTAAVKIGLKGRQRYVQQLCYAPGIQPDRLKEIFITGGWTGQTIYSEHDVNIITQLRRLGLPVIQARKGPGSVAAGHSKVRSYECFYTRDSVDMKKELDNYKFMTAQDIATGKEVITNVPIDAWDHLMNALTYGIYSHSFRRLDT